MGSIDMPIMFFMRTRFKSSYLGKKFQITYLGYFMSKKSQPNSYSKLLYTVCPKSSDPSYVVSYYINGVTTSWTFSNMVQGFLDEQHDDVYLVQNFVKQSVPFKCSRRLKLPCPHHTTLPHPHGNVKFSTQFLLSLPPPPNPFNPPHHDSIFSIYWVTQKLPQICTVMLCIRIGKVA